MPPSKSSEVLQGMNSNFCLVNFSNRLSVHPQFAVRVLEVKQHSRDPREDHVYITLDDLVVALC